MVGFQGAETAIYPASCPSNITSVTLFVPAWVQPVTVGVTDTVSVSITVSITVTVIVCVTDTDNVRVNITVSYC